jgi:hypothetical protein
MGIFLLNLPRIHYIAFELVEVDIQQSLSNRSYKATQITAIDLAVMPEQLIYKLQARDSITQTHSNIYKQGYDLQPERVHFSGTFGDDYRLVNNQYLDGWQRLKQFENEIVRRAKKHQDKNKIYCINYYDFVFQRFGSINIDSWTLSANARNNANLIQYTLDFTIIGEVIDINILDAFIKNLISGLFSGLSSGKYNIIDTFALSGLNYADYGVEILKELDASLEKALTSFSEMQTGRITESLKPVMDIFK